MDSFALASEELRNAPHIHGSMLEGDKFVLLPEEKDVIYLKLSLSLHLPTFIQTCCPILCPADNGNASQPAGADGSLQLDSGIRVGQC